MNSLHFQQPPTIGHGYIYIYNIHTYKYICSIFKRWWFQPIYKKYVSQTCVHLPQISGWKLPPKKSLKTTPAKTSRRTFFRACVFTIFLPHLWNGFIFFYGIYNVFLVPCIVLVSEMLSFTVVTKFNDILICKLHRFVLYEVVSKASRGSLVQQWFIRFLVFFQSNVFRKRVWIECSMYRSSPFRSTWNTGYITGLDMCPVCTEAVHSVALGTRVTLQVWTCVKYIPKQSIP